MNKSIYGVILGLPLLLASCDNGDQVFPDFDYQTIYFANQTPIQCITLGEDGEFDVTMDNEHRFQIYATLGGVNTNKQNRWVDYRIDNNMVNDIVFSDGTPVKALPAEYYTITSDPSRIYINKGEVMGAIDIQLNDAFFNDPETACLISDTENPPYVKYVIPVRLVEASDSILCGQLKDGIDQPNVLDESHWSVLPKNYVLYGIKYKNKYHGAWLSRGSVTIDGTTTTHEDPNGYWENEKLQYLRTKTLNQCYYKFSHAVAITDADGAIGEDVVSISLILDIDANGKVTITTDTEGCTAQGSGTYTYHGAGNAWGALERDQMELEYSYTIPYVSNKKTGTEATLQVSVKEKLVSRDRENKFETFNYSMK